MIKAVHLPATGPGPSVEDWELMDELEIIKHNHLLHSGKSATYPPLEIINEYLSRGIADHAMSGGMQWEPCTISCEKYSEYIASLGGVILEKQQIPQDISKIEYWYLYKHEINHQVPYKQHREYWDLLQRIKDEIKEARENKDEKRAMELHLEYVNVGNDSSNFYIAHFKR